MDLAVHKDGYFMKGGLTPLERKIKAAALRMIRRVGSMENEKIETKWAIVPSSIDGWTVDFIFWDVENKRWDRIEYEILKKGCKHKTEKRIIKL